MNLGKYVACICEGASEAAVIDVLLDQNLLIFDRERMLDEQVLRCRNASTFESRYLRKGFEGSHPSRSKSVYITESGKEQARALMEKYGIADWL